MINWILVPVRNGMALTRRAVRTFLAQDIKNVRVLLIDNATEDGTAEWARSMYPRVVAIRKDPPLGVAASWNKGLQLLFAVGDVGYVLVVNNDTELRPDTYRLLLKDGGGFVTAVSNINPDCVKSLAAPNGSTRPHPDFSCYLIRREVWDKVGQFDERFEGAYAEDLDYHLRMHQAGVNAHCIDMPFYHKRGSTLENMTEKESLLIQKQAEQNRKYFAEKWHVEGGTDEYYALFKEQLLPQGSPGQPAS